MTNPKTVQEALALVPEYILLRPGEAKPGDEWLGMGSYTWHELKANNPSEINLQRATDRVCRRRVPEHVRESIAHHIINGEQLEADESPFKQFAYNFPFEAWLLHGGQP